ncbi:hypothetical protein [Streptomyces clavuligerus]|nr:hypothetical protein [Streptomyces clavuligerus]ANW20222.1 topoisomerase II [Streptomyces clavuligerus]AXU14846.1 topoisomerase II [Streptomyces clavuligerus]MBY6304883.1 topoisomerase II [Streptomyces clavuligerus]QCS07618.1 topoisomerase II [Streptomyces clavuligerus]QPJ93037.1 topoisomerase II [Streptomyces clavuligerus]
MSHNEAGPYGGAHQQPGPYGGPGPYGLPPQTPQQGYGHSPQPGYGHSPQQPEPGYGYPQQMPGHGYPQGAGVQSPPGVPPQPGAGPNPYAQQPGPNPYAQEPGQPQPNPYAQPQQPGGWGPPPGQPGVYSTPQYPGEVPYPPSGGGNRKKTLAIVGAAVVALAVVAAGAYLVLNGGDGGSAVSSATKGYRLTPPATVAEFERKELRDDKRMGDADREEARKIGIRNPQEVQAEYQAGSPAEPLKQRILVVNGVWGEIDDPERTIDRHFALAENDVAETGGTKVKLTGTAKSVSPAGLDGAVMKCQKAIFTPGGANASLSKNWEVPICAWADHSTVATVIALDLATMMGGQGEFTEESLAALAAKLHATGRTKV